MTSAHEAHSVRAAQPRVQALPAMHASRSETEVNMKLVVLGATGGTGWEIVRQAMKRGHSVTALVRSPDRLKSLQDRIIVEQGDLLSSADLQQVIQGHDAVVSAFGPRVPLKKTDEHLLEQFARALTGAMLQTSVRRVVVESIAFLFKDSFLPPTYLLGRLLFSRIVADASAMEQIFAESELDWTMVRPPELTDKPYTGAYRVREGHLPRFGFRISRADVADFMITVVENRFAVRRVVGVSN
jgi:putative NADH-flavin reductase